MTQQEHSDFHQAIAAAEAGPELFFRTKAINQILAPQPPNEDTNIWRVLQPLCQADEVSIWCSECDYSGMIDALVLLLQHAQGKVDVTHFLSPRRQNGFVGYLAEVLPILNDARYHPYYLDP